MDVNNDLISRSALLEALNKLYMAALRKTAHSVETIYELDHLSMLVKDAPAVDAVEVVRCNDCKHGKLCFGTRGEPTDILCVQPNMFPLRVVPDFYCTYGARMDAEVEG